MKKAINEMGENIPVKNFLGGNFPGGYFPGESLIGGSFRAGIFPGGIFLEPSKTTRQKTTIQEINIPTKLIKRFESLIVDYIFENFNSFPRKRAFLLHKDVC